MRRLTQIANCEKWGHRVNAVEKMRLNFRKARNQSVSVEEGEERPARPREYDQDQIVVVAALGLLLFHVVVAVQRWPQPLERRALHVGLGLAFLFLLRIRRGANSIHETIIDAACIAILLAHSAFFLRVGNSLSAQVGNVSGLGFWLGLGVIIITIEATRRTIGWGLVLLVLGTLAYGAFGSAIPGEWGHGGFSVRRLVGHMYLGFNGLFGIPTSASVEYIYLFLTLAAFLTAIGASQRLGDLALGLFGRVRGGPAKVSVVGSALFGTVSGSAVANVASVGPFSIPLMVRSGLSSRQAASIEAVSSVGSQFVPPVMGASAFIMAEFLGVPYSDIVIAAILPAVIYYTAEFIIVDFHSAKLGIGGVSDGEIAESIRALRQVYLLLPLLVVLLTVGVFRFSPERSALWALATTAAVAFINPEARVRFVQIFKVGVVDSASIAMPVIAAVAASGIVVGILSITGLGNKLSSLILGVAGDRLWLLLLLVMVAAIILGAGLPTVPTYVILATLLAPAMIQFGIHPIAAHLFIFYFGALSDLTPPTAVTVVVAAGIARVNPWSTMFTATKVGLFGYIVPFLFVFHQDIILVAGFDGVSFAISIASILISIFSLAAGLEGWCLRPLAGWARILLLVNAALGLVHSITMVVVPALVLAAVIVYAYRTPRDRGSIGTALEGGAR